MCTRLGLNQLQSRTNGISSRISSAAQQSISLTHLYQHGAEVIALCQVCLDGIHVHLALAQIKHGLCHLFHLRIGCRINDSCTGNIKVSSCSSVLYFLFSTDQDNIHQVILQQACSSLQNAGIRALSENNCSAICLQCSNQILKHL